MLDHARISASNAKAAIIGGQCNVAEGPILLQKSSESSVRRSLLVFLKKCEATLLPPVPLEAAVVLSLAIRRTHRMQTRPYPMHAAVTLGSGRVISLPRRRRLN